MDAFLIGKGCVELVALSDKFMVLILSMSKPIRGV